MNRSIIAVAILAVVIGGCTTVRTPRATLQFDNQSFTVSNPNGFDGTLFARPDPHAVKVFITDDGQIVLDQEPVRPTVRQGPLGNEFYVVTWALDNSSSSNTYVFPNDSAITFVATTGSSPPPGYRCQLAGPNRKAIWCLYPKRDTPFRWKYSITVSKPDGSSLTALDPWVYQN